VTSHRPGDLRKKQIILAARRVILKEGSEHLTISKMAHQIGVSEAAIYRHFENKREILSFLVEDIGRTLNPDANLVTTDTANVLDLMEKVFMAQFSGVNRRKGISFLILAEIISLGDKQLNAQSYGIVRKFVEGITKVLNDGRLRGQVRPDIDAESFSTLFFGMMQGLVTIWTLSKHSFDIEERYRRLWTTLRVSASRN
jgi:AcrR family transcriptional regulator